MMSSCSLGNEKLHYQFVLGRVCKWHNMPFVFKDQFDYFSIVCLTLVQTSGQLTRIYPILYNQSWILQVMIESSDYLLVRELRTKEPNPRAKASNQKKEKQAKGTPPTRGEQESKGMIDTLLKPQDKGKDINKRGRDLQGGWEEVSLRRHLPPPHSIFCTNLTSRINKEMTSELQHHSQQLKRTGGGLRCQGRDYKRK